MYDSWYIKVQQREFFVILGHFLLFHPPPPPKDKENQNFGKLKKKPRDIIILHMCTINDNHLKYGSWDMEHNRQNFFLILDLFCLFTINQNFEKLKKTVGDIIILHKSTKNHDNMLHYSWDTAHVDVIFYIPFGAIFCPFTPITTQKI